MKPNETTNAGIAPASQLIPQYVSLSGRFTFSQDEVAEGVIMASDEQGALGMSEYLKSQEAHGPLSKAKDLLVLDWSGNLVFVGDYRLNPEEKAAYSAAYFYTAGWFDRESAGRP